MKIASNVHVHMFYSEDDRMSCQLVDDTYECFSLLCHSSEGIEVMLQEKTVSTLCKAVTSGSYG